MDATNTGQRSLGECKNSTAWPGVAEQHVETEENGAGCMEPASTNSLTEPYLEAKPGWTRVKTKARASSTKVRHIMTRIGAIALRFRRKKKTTETQDQGERCELPRPRRQRTEAFKPCHGDWALVGCPQSKAEMASLVMAAQVEIANRVLELPDHAFVAELDHFLKSVHTKVIPTKRGIDRHYHLDQVGIVGGYRLKTYERIWPILEKGAAMAGRKIDVQAAAFAQLAAHLQQTRRNPRVQIAAHGQPDLSDIADMTEPESFIALVGAPMVTADAKSPLKRAAQPHSPVRDKAARLSETKVELLPASTPRVEPSPIKSAPLAASFADTPAPRKLVAMSPETLAAGSSVRMAPGQAPSSPLRPNTATRVFRVPSDDDDSTLTPKTYTTTKTFQVSPDDDITLTPTVRTATGVFMAPSCDSSSSSSFGINTSHERADAQNGDHLVLVPKHNTFSNARRLPSDDESSLSLDANNSFGATPIPTGHRLALSINSSTPPQAFRVASGDNFGSGPEHAGAQTLPAQLSPVDSTRHVTLTPAGRHQSESTTPHTSVPMPSLRTPSPPREKLGLVDAIPSCTPRLLVTKPEGFDSSKRTSFDFGGTSPSFNALSLTSLSWVNSRRAVEAQEKHRRKSEPPLLRPFFKSRVPAGLSTSPKKVRFHDGFVDTNSLSPGLLGSRPCEHEPANANTHQRPVSHTPETTITPSAALGGTATPAISWAQMTGRAASDAVGQSTPQTSNQVNDRKSVFSVDIRRNLNIFGGDEDTPSKQRYNAVALLAHIAEANCDGQAKVVVTQEHGRLFVRFKLPTKFAFMFPPDQGFNESRFTTTPSISSSPRIRVHGPSPSVQGGVPSPRHSPLQTPAVDSAHHDNIVMCDDFAPSPLGFHTDPASGHGEHVDQDVNDSFSLSIDATENFGYEDRSTTIPWDQVSGLRLDSQDDGATPFQPPQSDAMDRSDGSLTELMTPDVEMTPAPEYEGSPERMWTRSNVESGGQTADQEHGMTASFTQRPAPDQRLDREYKASIYHIHRQAADDDECDWDHEPRQEQDDAVRARDHDSPGRDYMRDFISRSKPKRLSATETGSPIAFSAKRQPLGAKDPNTESPLMGRRKTQAGEQQQAQSPFKRGAAPMLNHQSFVVDEDDEMEDGEPTKSARARENVATWHQSDEEMVDAPLARRSSRLLTLKRQMASKRSSTADPATVSKRSGSGRGHAPKAKSKRDASQQTRLNTRRNKGNAEYPAQLLARQGLDEMDVDAPARHPRKTTKSSKCTKSVRWNEPLRSLQDESPKKMTIRDTQARAGVADRKKPKGTVRQMAKQLASVKEPPGRQGRITRAAARALE